MRSLFLMPESLLPGLLLGLLPEKHEPPLPSPN